MDHREQMQAEAEQWQKTSVKLVRGIRYGVLILGLLVVLVLFLRNVGFSREINEMYTAAVIIEGGQQLECTVEIRGEVTNYPLNRDKAGADDKVVIYANKKRLVEVYYKQGGEYLFAQRGDTVCIMTPQRDAVVLETDLQNIFPEMESKRCLLVSNYANANTIWDEVNSIDLPTEFLEKFTFF